MMPSRVREMPGAYIKDAEMRVRESSLVSEGASVFLAGAEGVGLVASLCSVRSPPALIETKRCTVARLVQRCSSPASCNQQREPGDHFTHTWRGKIQLPKIRGSKARGLR